MKDLTQKEFEQQIQRIVDGEIGKKELAKELNTSIRNLDRKITGLSESNHKLYLAYVKEHPYKPKEIKVDVEELALYAIVHGISKTVEEYGMSRKTLSRKIEKLEKVNLELYSLYQGRNIINSKSASQFDKDKYVYDLSKYMEKLEKRKKQNSFEEKRAELKKTISEFEKLVSSGMSKAAAARALGYDNYPTIWKKYQELNRIETELDAKEELSQNGWKENIKVNVKPMDSKKNEKVVMHREEKGMEEK